MEENIFDFGGVDSPSEKVGTGYLNPGEFEVTEIESKLVLPTIQGKNAYITVTFKAEDGIVNRNFYITTKALNLLQYVNETITDKKLTRAFKTPQEVSNWFDLIFKGYNAGKTKKVAVIVGREINGDKTYSRVKDFGFFLPIEKGQTFENREYTEEEIVASGLSKVNNYQGGSPQSNDTQLPTMGMPSNQIPTYVPDEPVAVGAGYESDDLPF